jgi:hypothetical protein
MFRVSLVPLTPFFHKVLTSRIAVLPFAGVFKNVIPSNGEGVLHTFFTLVLSGVLQLRPSLTSDS